MVRAIYSEENAFDVNDHGFLKWNFFYGGGLIFQQSPCLPKNLIWECKVKAHCKFFKIHLDSWQL